MNKTKILISALFIFFISSIFINPALAKEKTSAELQKQIEMLQKRVEELESEKQQRQNLNNDALSPARERMRNPFEDIYRMQEEMNRLFQNSFTTNENASKGFFSNNMSYDDKFEIKDQKDKYILEVDMKGLNQEKTNIQINDRYITIKGEQSIENKQEENGSYVSSKSFSSFMRTFPLPEDADTSNVKSDKKGDKIIITLPKKK